MMNAKVVFYIVMCLLLCVQMPVYSHYKVKGKGREYTLTKCAGSLVFTVTAIVGTVLTPDVYSFLITAAMLLSAAGDYLLSRTSHHRLKAGGAAFAAAHLCFMAAFIYAAGFHWQTVPVTAALFAAELGAAKLIGMKNRGAGIGMAIYIVTVTMMAVSAGAMLLTEELTVPMSLTSQRMTAIGGVLFLVSDFFWMTYGMIFSKAKASLKIANVLTYFPAQILIAGALLFR